MFLTLGHYAGEHTDAHVVSIGAYSLYFSYRTVVAFSSPEHGLVVRENSWGPTTGKHLNAISTDKSKRLKSEEFIKKLDDTMSMMRGFGGKV
jgi:hypothetical protein